MKPPVKLSERVSVGGQPSEEDLRQLVGQGFRSVINLRQEGESNQPIGPDAEGDHAVSVGLEYRHIPVSVDALSSERVDKLRAALEDLPGPVFVHCGAGQRAAALSLLTERDGTSAEDVLQEVEGKGVELSDASVRTFIREYLSKD